LHDHQECIQTGEVTSDRVVVGVSGAECRVLNDRWRALRAMILAALPDAWAVVVTVRLDRAGLSSSVMVVDAAFEALDLRALETWGELLEEAVELLGPGEFGLSRPEAFRVASAKGGYASAGF
jgi:hypothetical protein